MQFDMNIYSAIDACLNRGLEGLRVVEDVMRFSLRRHDAAARLKELRHRLREASAAFPREFLLHARDVAGDAQKFADLPAELRRDRLADVVGANLRRAMEAARSLEELGKLQAVPGNPFQSIRFELYELEKELVPLVARATGKERFHNALYCILDRAFVGEGDYVATAARMIDGGAAVLQLRMKGAGSGRVLAVAREVAGVCRERGVLFFVNDHPDIALLARADGVHLGQEDIGVAEARSFLPGHMLIGVSTHTVEQAVKAQADDPDYIAIGPFRETRSKHGQPIPGIGAAAVASVRAVVTAPLVAIGGITPADLPALRELGVDSVAVISWLFRNGALEENCRELARGLADRSSAKPGDRS